MLPYLLTFCRIVIGLVFAYAFLAKIRDVRRFAETISNFEILPKKWSKVAALLLLGGEGIVLVLILLGGWPLSLAFALAGLMLLLFTIVFISALQRNIQTSCNCFGVSEKPLTYYDVWRNIGFLLLATAGLGLRGAIGELSSLAFIELLFILLIAAVLVMAWINLGEIVDVFRAT